MLISFAVSNRAAVALGFWPLPYSAEIPLFLIAFAGLGLGFVAGEAHAWIGRRRLRRDLRRRTREVESLQRALAARKAQSGEAPGAVSLLPPTRGR
ncbi:MAG: lipopolysaccharide assembly protein LapA domain-containing protein [Stellaceae bacterium]